MTSAPILSAAETIAASLCWLARMPSSGKAIGPAADAQVGDYWHNGRCRFCDVDRKELMARIHTAQADQRWADMERTFNHLERKARAARVREAMEEPWWDEATR